MSHDNFDDIFDLLDSDRLEALYDSYVENYQDTPDPVTPELDAAMQKKFDELRKQEQLARVRKKLSRIAAALIVLLGVGGFAVTQTEAWKVTINNLKLSFADAPLQTSHLSASDIEKLSILPKHTPYPQNIPNGYSVYSVDVGDTRIEIVFHKPDCADLSYKVFFTDYPEFDQTAVKESAKNVTINNWNGYMIQHSQKSDLIWYTQSHIFKISGCIDENILISIAESVK